MPVWKGIKASPGVAEGPLPGWSAALWDCTALFMILCRERDLYEGGIVLGQEGAARLQQHAQGADADILMFQIALLEDESFTNEIGDYISAGAGSAAAVERAGQIFCRPAEQCGQ